MPRAYTKYRKRRRADNEKNEENRRQDVSTRRQQNGFADITLIDEVDRYLVDDPTGQQEPVAATRFPLHPCQGGCAGTLSPYECGEYSWEITPQAVDTA